MRSLMICTPHPIFFSGNKIENNEMGEACRTYRGRREAYEGLWWRNLGERDHLGDPGVNGGIIIRWIFRK
jgi:hypothetical protein